MDHPNDHRSKDSEAGADSFPSTTTGTRPPAFQFYPGDWLSRLQSLLPEARGIWLTLMCHMHRYGQPYGHLAFEPGKPIPVEDLARMCAVSPRRMAQVLEELLQAGIGAKGTDGVIYSPRMVRDEARREARAKGGIKSLENPNVPRPKPGDSGDERTSFGSS